MFTPPLKNVNFKKFTPYVPGGVISVPKQPDRQTVRPFHLPQEHENAVTALGKMLMQK